MPNAQNDPGLDKIARLASQLALLLRRAAASTKPEDVEAATNILDGLTLALVGGDVEVWARVRELANGLNEVKIEEQRRRVVDAVSSYAKSGNLLYARGALAGVRPNFATKPTDKTLKVHMGRLRTNAGGRSSRGVFAVAAAISIAAEAFPEDKKRRGESETAAVRRVAQRFRKAMASRIG